MKKTFLNKLRLTLAVVFGMVFTLLIFGPCEIVGVNDTSFRFNMTDIAGTMILFALIVYVITCAVAILLPEKIWKVCMLLAVAATVCSYAQAMFMNGPMESLLGQDISFGALLKAGNGAIWIALCVVIFIVGYKCKSWDKILGAVALVLTAIQLLAFISLFVNAKPSEEISSILTDKGTFELSKNNTNVVVFILDTVDGRVVDEILASEPDYLDDYDGFTYYPNCTSVYSRTYPSITYLLTDNRCNFDMPYEEWIAQSYEQGSFIDTLYNNNVDIGLYTNSQYVAPSCGEELCNFYSGKEKLNYKSIIKQSIKMVLYRDLPYVLKSYCEYDPTEVEKKILWLDDQAHVFDDRWYEDRLKNEVLKADIDKPTFRFYHLAAYHHGFNADSAIKSFDITKAYIRQMKELGIYDNSTIIIMADHGYSGAGETLDLPQQTAVPLMMVKLSGDSGTSLRISEAPVSQTEFEPTVLEAYGMVCDRESIDDIKEDSNRERLYYYSALYSDEEGEVELREYSVKGDARYPESYVFTGNAKDILYSENTVSNK